MVRSGWGDGMKKKPAFETAVEKYYEGMGCEQLRLFTPFAKVGQKNIKLVQRKKRLERA